MVLFEVMGMSGLSIGQFRHALANMVRSYSSCVEELTARTKVGVEPIGPGVFFEDLMFRLVPYYLLDETRSTATRLPMAAMTGLS